MEDCTDHAGAEAHEEVLEVSPGRGAHRLLGGAGELREAGHELAVTLAQLVAAARPRPAPLPVPHCNHQADHTTTRAGNKPSRSFTTTEIDPY